MDPLFSSLHILITAGPNRVEAYKIAKIDTSIGVYLDVKTCEVCLCFVAFVRDGVYYNYVTFLFSLFYVTGECHRFLHRE